MTVCDELRAAWNGQADSHNQWDELGIDEIVAFAQEVERMRAADEIERLRAELDALKAAPPSVPGLTGELFERIQARAERSYRRHSGSIRGQQITPQDDFNWHLIHATCEELKAAPKPGEGNG